MANLNLIDPNKIILGDNHPFKDLGNGIPSFEDIRSYVQLTMHPKNSNYIEILNGSVVGNSNVDSGEEIVLTGYHTQSVSKGDNKYNYYSTNYTEDNYKNKDGNFEYEGFGIKDIDITFDANKIPQVAITFYDVRGNVLNNFDSKFAKMFQLPYPIFELKIKGGFGPTITYRLQKIRDDISIDNSGNYTISSKFIGDRFAPLSDLPLNYLQAVPYLDNQAVDVADNVIKSFHELMINAKRLYEKLNQEVNSDNELKTQEDLTKLTDKLRSLTDIITVLNTKEEFISGITGDVRYTNFNKETKDRISNYLNLTTIQDNKISLKEDVKAPLVPRFTLTDNDYNFISDVILKQVESKNSAITSQGEGILIVFNSLSKTISGNTVGGNIVTYPISIDYTQLYNKIIELNKQITEKAKNNAATLTDKLSKLVKDNLGGKRLTIGDIFSLLFQDYNKLMNKIFDAGKAGLADDARLKNNQTYDKIGFPTVVENGKLIYPGASSKVEFKNWPEVKLIEEFIDAFVKSQVNNLLTDLLLSKNEDGSSKYIPINPREIYQLSNDRIPLLFKNDNIQNVYVSRTENQICQLIYERFLIFTNINLNITATDYGDWTNENNENSFFQKWVVELFKTGLEDTETQKGIFLSTISAEARNIAFALMIADDKTKDYFINLATQFTGYDYFAANPNQPLSSTKVIVDKQVVDTLQIPTTQLMGIGLGLSNDKNYVTVNDSPPQLINTASPSEDIITKYMLGIHNLSENYKITKDNLFYISDDKLEASGKGDGPGFDSEYIQTDVAVAGPTNDLILSKNLYYYFNNGVGFGDYADLDYCLFSFNALYDNCRFPSVLEIPKAMLIIMGGLLFVNEKYYPNEPYWDIKIGNAFVAKESIFRIIKDSNFYNFLKNQWRDASDNKKGFSYTITMKPYITIIDAAGAVVDTVLNAVEDVLDDVVDFFGSLITPTPVTPTPPPANTTPIFKGFESITIKLKVQPTTDEQKKEINKYLYTPMFLSVNSKEFTSRSTPDTKFFSNNNLYAQYLKQLLSKLAELVKDDKKTLEDKLKNYKNQMQDNDIKLSMYKSFQVIYENYLYGSSPAKFEFDTKTNFKFVDRAYNDISKIGVLDIKTLLSDTQDTNVSLLTAISRLLSDNNYWFYPFQGFLTTSDNYNSLFKIDYRQTVTTEPMFVAMYVGGLSSNPIPPPNATTLANDGILQNEVLPDDFGKTTGSFDAFKVKYTGTQNQMVFSDFQHSTESLKNTDEGLRIQSEIVGNASNSLAIPKGQSLLTVYQKQSYTSTVKIPFGNMGIQPTQYYYLEFIPIFEGLYIIYNVTHNINSDTQRLETTFKGYRVKKDINPLITDELVDFTRNNFYTQTLDTIGSNNSNTNITSKASDKYDNTLSYEQNARNFVLGNEGFTAYIYWDIDAWRLGYGSQVMALNSSLTAVGNDIYNPKHYITLPTGEKTRNVQVRGESVKQKYSTKWPITYDLNTGKVGQVITLSDTHTVDYKTYTANNGHQWNPVIAGKSKNDAIGSTYTKNFYTSELADRAFGYSFKTIYSDPIRKKNPTGYDKLSGAAKIAVGYIAYGFGSIQQQKIIDAIASGNDLDVAKAIVERLVIREGTWVNKSYWKCAKYIDGDIYNKLTDEVKAKVIEFSKSKNFVI